jgi:hypothetical protein
MRLFLSCHAADMLDRHKLTILDRDLNKLLLFGKESEKHLLGQVYRDRNAQCA